MIISQHPGGRRDDQKLKVTCDYRTTLFGLGYMVIYLKKKKKERKRKRKAPA